MQDSSNAKYEKAFLTVQVPKSLGRALTANDLHAQGNAATIDIVARCEGSGFVAEEVRRDPRFTAWVVTHRGHMYQGVMVHIPAPGGASLGSVALLLPQWRRERPHSLGKVAGRFSQDRSRQQGSAGLDLRSPQNGSSPRGAFALARPGMPP